MQAYVIGKEYEIWVVKFIRKYEDNKLSWPLAKVTKWKQILRSLENI